jgi:hypothetical protein
MSKRIKYDFERLDNYCKANNVTLLDDYSECQLTKNSIIKGNCVYENCQETFEKKFINLIDSGGYCKICIKLMLVNRMKQTFLEKYGSENILQLDFIKEKTNPHKFTFQKLQDYCKEYSIELCEDYSKCHLTKKSLINAKCQSNDCPEITSKIFREIEKRGIYCKKCMNDIKIEKTQKYCLKKYGVTNSLACKEVQEKVKKTNIQKYGFEFTFQSEEIKEKIKQSNLQKYGVEFPTQNKEIMNKIKQTNLEKYGCETTLYAKEIRPKVRKTIMDRYGVEYILQNAEIAEKASNNSYKTKTFKLPSGKVLKCQGYEPFAIRDLLEANINEDDILNKRTEVPKILFNDNNEEHRYYVDIYIPSQNKCIEVKSIYTYKKYIKTNLLKQEAAKKLGYDFDFWIYDNKGNRVNICDCE